MALRYAPLDALVDGGYLKDLRPSEKDLLIAIGRFVNHRTDQTFVGRDRLMRYLVFITRHLLRPFGVLKRGR